MDLSRGERVAAKNRTKHMTTNKQNPESINYFFKGFFDNAREATIVIDPSDGLIATANKKALSLFSLTPEDISNKSIIDILRLNPERINS